MQSSEEKDLREGLVYDPYVKGYDSNFWKGDTANLLFDTVKNAIKVGDTALAGSASSYSQYLYGDFEFTMRSDSVSPDSNDSEKRWGLQNPGDTLERGAAYFEMRYDTVAGGDTGTTRPLRAVVRDEAGTVQRKNITWDTLWGTGANTRYRISWEADGYTFLINDTVYATLGDKPDTSTSHFSINTSIPQALRLSNRSIDTSDTAALSLKLLNIRHARKII